MNNNYYKKYIKYKNKYQNLKQKSEDIIKKNTILFDSNVYNFNKLFKNKSKICIVQYDNRELTGNIKYLQSLNEKYCKKYNHDYYFYNEKSSVYPPYWMKVYLIYLLLPKYDYVMWLDTDATLINIVNLDDFIKEHIDSKDMLISYDMPTFNPEKFSLFNQPVDLFNAGVFVMKNSVIGNNIMKDWLTKFQKDSWRIKNDKWKCINILCVWAGVFYEQGAFHSFVYPNYIDKISKVSWKILNNPQYEKNIQSVFHFAGPYKNKLDIEEISTELIL